MSNKNCFVLFSFAAWKNLAVIPILQRRNICKILGHSPLVPPFGYLQKKVAKTRIHANHGILCYIVRRIYRRRWYNIRLYQINKHFLIDFFIWFLQRTWQGLEFLPTIIRKVIISDVFNSVGIIYAWTHDSHWQPKVCSVRLLIFMLLASWLVLRSPYRLVARSHWLWERWLDARDWARLAVLKLSPTIVCEMFWWLPHVAPICEITTRIIDRQRPFRCRVKSIQWKLVVNGS